MALFNIEYPLINGVRHEFSSIDGRINGTPYKGFKSINYDDECTTGDVYGTDPVRVGRTQGQYKAAADFEMYEAEANIFLAALTAESLGGGYLEGVFLLTVMKASKMGPVITDTLTGCKIKKISNPASAGSDALVMKFEIDVMTILRNGLPAIARNPLKLF